MDASILFYINAVVSMVTFVFFVIIVVKMFQNGDPGLGVITIVTTCCCGGIGYIIALILGWGKANEWKIKDVMVIYTTCLVANLVLVAVTYQENYEKYQTLQKEFIKQQKRTDERTPSRR